MCHRVDRVRACISIHALLAESDAVTRVARTPTMISIHALLAESDHARAKSGQQRSRFLSTLSLRRATANWFDLWGWAEYFYPRSPCGERRFTERRH